MSSTAIPARRLRKERADWKRRNGLNGFHGEMRIGLAVMERQISAARDALAVGDVLQMIPAYQALKDYSDDD